MPFEKAAFAVLLVCATGLGILIAQEASKATAPKSSATKKTTASSKKKTARKKTTASRKTSKTTSKKTSATATKKTSTTASTQKSTAASRKRSSKKSSTASWRRGQQTPTPARYKEIQQALIAKGYMQAPATGEWGPESVGALKRFQGDQKLEPTGKLDALSLIGLGLGPRNDLSVRSSQATAKPHKEEP